ncbi:MAG: hypothetical protein GF311_26195 [Candidatus Lokiarchaeota archaeon]|nr:hypothetical protein [Candidatus Lokiarchaeota archaeon]
MMKIRELLKIHIKKVSENTIIFSKKTRLWCRLPYPDHPKGCPNYNKNRLCPPKIKYMNDLTQKYNFYYLVYAIFDLKNQKERMLKRNPKWSKRQAKCLLYWQRSVKKYLKDYLLEIYEKNRDKDKYLLSCGSGFKSEIFDQEIIPSMEAAGIDVYRTMKNNHIDFEIKPNKKVILVNLICTKEKLQI